MTMLLEMKMHARHGGEWRHVKGLGACYFDDGWREVIPLRLSLKGQAGA